MPAQPCDHGAMRLSPIVLASGLIAVVACGDKADAGRACVDDGSCASGHCLLAPDVGITYCTDVCTTEADCPDVAGRTKSCGFLPFPWADGSDWCNYIPSR